MDRYSPRSRIGVGPTVRVSNDADEIIMGTKIGKSRTQSTRSIPPGEHRLSRIGSDGVLTPGGGLTKDNGCDLQDVGNGAHPPRVSSLPNSPEVADTVSVGK